MKYFGIILGLLFILSSLNALRTGRILWNITFYRRSEDAFNYWFNLVFRLAVGIMLTVYFLDAEG